MSQCVSCANQPSDNDSLGGAGHEGAVTPMVAGIIVGTVIMFVLVVCALFYCVRLENDRLVAKKKLDVREPSDAGAAAASVSDVDHSAGTGVLPSSDHERGATEGSDSCEATGLVREGPEEDSDRRSVKSRPSSVTMVSTLLGGDDAGCTLVASGPGTADSGGSNGKKRLFSWSRRSSKCLFFFYYNATAQRYDLLTSFDTATPANNVPVTTIEMV